MSGKRAREQRREEAAAAAAAPHTWVQLIPYRLTDQEAAAGVFEGATVILSADKVVREIMPPPGCFACEEPYNEVVGKPCPGQPPGRLEYVT